MPVTSYLTRVTYSLAGDAGPAKIDFQALWADGARRVLVAAALVAVLNDQPVLAGRLPVGQRKVARNRYGSTRAHALPSTPLWCRLRS